MRLAHKLPIVFCVILALSALSLSADDSGQNHRDFSLGVTIDPAKVTGPDSCTKCHGEELQAWRQTPHFATFDTLHRRSEAKEIAKRMGIRSIKRGGICIGCHYTPQGTSTKAKPIAGVSCEMCHGAASDWIAIHNDYGGPDVTKEQESTGHRQSRIEESIRLGMRNPVNVYLIARSCFNCHTVPNEKLVNVGGHAAGTADFEFVSWSQGKVRHNFLRTDYTSNATSDRNRLRVMYVVGRMTDLEYSLRATAQATTKHIYGTTAALRVYYLRRQLADLQETLNDPRLEDALIAAYGVKLKSKNRQALEEAASAVGQSAYAFAEEVDGSALASIDGNLPSESTYK